MVVAENGGDLDVAADGLDVAGDGLDGGDLAALDLGDPALGHAHPLGIALRHQPCESADLSPPVSRIADRHGANANRIRTSVRPDAL